MPKTAKIAAALGDVSAIDSFTTLQAEMADLFTGQADRLNDWDDKRPGQTIR